MTENTQNESTPLAGGDATDIVIQKLNEHTVQLAELKRLQQTAAKTKRLVTGFSLALGLCLLQQGICRLLAKQTTSHQFSNECFYGQPCRKSISTFSHIFHPLSHSLRAGKGRGA